MTDIKVLPDTPQADYDELRRLIIRDIGQMGSVSEPILTILHRLRPKGVKLTAIALVTMYDHVTARTYFLCCTRKVDAHLPVEQRRICFPGGHVDPEDFLVGGSLNDTIKHAALRELEEETGLKGNGAKIVYRDIDECNTLCYMVRVTYLNSALANKPEPGTAVLWLTLDEMLKRAAWPGYYRRAFEKGMFLS